VVMATIHPAAILRSRDSASREAEREAFTRDLAAVAAVLK
jgi:uracil-DNA glycosylase